MATPGDYGDSLDTELANAADQQGYILNSGNNTTALGNIYSDPNTNPGSSTDANSPVTTGSVYKNQTPTTMADVQKFISDNKGLITAGGAALGLMGGNNPQYGKTGYQGTIPSLTATRTMVTAPPTREQGYRPGQGGINYGGDVTYTRTPGQDPWANLSGTNNSGSGLNALVKTAAPAAAATNLGSKGYQAAIAAGQTPMQYLNGINQWILDNPNASQADIAAAMKKFDVTDADVQAALGESTFSDATKYYMTHGQGLDALNKNILKWVQDNPYATREQINQAIQSSGVDTRDIGRAFGTENKMSPLMEYALTHGMGMDEVYQNIARYKSEDHTPEEIADMIKRSGASQADIAAADQYVNKTNYDVSSAPTPPSSDVVKDLLASNAGADDATFAKMMKESNISDKLMAEVTGIPEAEIAARRMAVGYAAGGMAKGRYLQGNTDGMADELPARIGQDQPAALSHGEFVVPADVVSHLGNGNSDAGAKKLYQMMDKIRMARTGTKQQGKKINPDKFMPGGLASAKFAGGGDVSGTAISSGLTGVESNLSNWAGPYVTNMLGQGQALANMPYQAYMGPLTAGESSLQTNAFKTASGLSTPASIGQAATTAGNLANRASNLSYTPQTTDFLGNPMRSGLATNQMDPGAAYRDKMGSTGAMPPGLDDLAFYAMPAKTAADRAGTPPTGPQTGLAGLLQGMGAANAQPAPAVDEAGRPVAMGADGRPIAPTTGGVATLGSTEQQPMPQYGSMQAPQVSQTPQASQQLSSIAQQYMNPYLEAALKPQLEEARRQSLITQQQNAAKMTQAGAFGGGRQAILDAETQRALGSNLANITGQGYNTAYDKAMAQFNADQARKSQEAQFGATFGLQGLQTGIQGAQTQGTLGTQQNQADINNLNAQLTAGAQQRGIESEGIAADKAAFEEARANPYKMVQFQQSLLQGLPLAAQNYNLAAPSALSQAAAGATTVADLISILSGQTAAKKI